MSKFVQTGLIVGATISIAAASVTSAQALEVSQVYLAYKASEKTDCPRAITMKARALTDGPGTVKFIFRMAGGGKSGELSAQSVKGADGKYSASYTQVFSIPKNTETKYMVEVVGKGKISPWIDFNEECGPQPRKETKTTGAPPRKGRHISELDKDPKPSGEGKPLPSGEGKPLPGGGGKPIAHCKGTVTAKRVAAVTQAGGIASAWIAWSAGVKKLHGSDWDSVNNAKDKNSSCNWLGTYTCTVSAKPCRS